MKQNLEKNIELLKRPVNRLILSKVQRGIERECLRVDEEGFIAQTLHPKELGSSLTNPFITTDFSEALLEFVTPTFNSPEKLINFLEDLHIFTAHKIGSEFLWPISMPCLKKNQKIPIADYGTSNIGKMKTLYRVGLHHRYGSPMQIISGIHYNFSMPDEFWPLFKNHQNSYKSIQDFKSERYLHLIRNVHKYGWLILYLFGASPSVCTNFFTSSKQLEGMSSSADKNSYYLNHATSLRMSHLGYQNKATSTLSICHRTLDNYIEDLTQAIFTKDSQWKKLGLYKNGKQIQISDNLLQIENEYYSSIRPKRRIRTSERPTTALKERGIEYIELRNLDINPWSVTGIDQSQVKFLDVFLTWCLLQNAEPCNNESQIHQKHNNDQVVLRGREENIKLLKNNKEISLKSWAQTIFSELISISELYDNALHSNYTSTIKKFETYIEDPIQTYSGQMLPKILEKNLHQFAYEKGKSYQKYLLNQTLNNDSDRMLTEVASNSLNKQIQLENSEDISFDEYIKRYFSC